MDSHRLLRDVLAAGMPFLALAACGGDTTDPQADITPPSILSVVPVDGSADVSVAGVVAVVFSEPVELASASSSVIVVSRASQSLSGLIGHPVPNVLTFNPSEVLDPGAQYAVSLTTDVTDTAGNALEQGQTWSFSTASTPPGTLSELRIVQEIAGFSHDTMAGRGSGTEDELLAAEYIRSRFLELGLEPPTVEYFQSFPIPPDRVDGQTGLTSQNVLGVLTGQGDLSDQWVFVGAHYDHEGVRDSAGTTQILNGADDNASGTALMLAIARAMREQIVSGELSGQPRRSVMFQAYGAEELGLVGSEFYCAHPSVPHTDVNGLLNFDMVGRLRNDELFVSGLWTSVDWRDLLQGNDPHSLDIIDKQDCQSCSDYASFRRRSIPAIWLFTGFHAEYGTPQDDVELINGPGILKIGELSVATLVDLMTRPERLPFDKVLPTPPATPP